jgi:hypothetical protein
MFIEDYQFTATSVGLFQHEPILVQDFIEKHGDQKIALVNIYVHKGGRARAAVFQTPTGNTCVVFGHKDFTIPKQTTVKDILTLILRLLALPPSTNGSAKG